MANLLVLAGGCVQWSFAATIIVVGHYFFIICTLVVLEPGAGWQTTGNVSALNALAKPVVTCVASGQGTISLTAGADVLAAEEIVLAARRIIQQMVFSGWKQFGSG